MADVMVSWNIPNIRIAHEIRSSLADYDRTGDPREIEAAIRRGFDREVDAAIESDPGDPLSQMLKAERAKEMLLDAVRFRARRRASGGTVADSSVRNLPAPMRAIVHDDPATAVAELDGLPPGFRAAMDRWTTSDDIRTLADDLDRASAGLAATLYARDPLGLGVPVGYLWQVENEARNLRLVARGVAGEIDRDEVEMRLVMP
jgi:vacuolar-type H+-ATPase subunit C/Vma6